MTNRHVVDGAEQVQVNTWDGRTFTSPFAAVALYSDIALVVLDESAGRPPVLARDDPAPGDRVFAAGYPLGGPRRVTSGKVLGYVPAQDPGGGGEINVGNAVRVSAEIMPGNSGGPLLNSNGEVVGVVFATVKATGEGLAIPVSTLRMFADRVQAGDVWDAAPPLGC